MSYFPTIDERLILALQEQFPDKCPDINLSEKEVWFKAGQASVARWLERRSEEQTEGDVFQLREVV